MSIGREIACKINYGLRFLREKMKKKTSISPKILLDYTLNLMGLQLPNISKHHAQISPEQFRFFSMSISKMSTIAL